MTGGDKFLLCRRIDTVEARRNRGRATDPHVHFFGTCGPHHLHNLAAGGAPDDGIVDQYDPFARKQMLDRIQLNLYAEVSNTGFRLDKGSANVVIADQAESERDAALLSETDSGGNAGIRNRYDQIGID